jgi:hypothetical protein
MSRRQQPGKPAFGSTPAARQLVPPQASSPEPGPPAERLAYSVDEAAHLTGLSRDLLYDEMRRGHLCRWRLVTRQHLEQFLGITPGPPPPAALTTAGGLKAAAGAP